MTCEDTIGWNLSSIKLRCDNPTMLKYLLLLIFGFISLSSVADGPFGIDHMITKDESGIWSRKKQLDLQYGSFLVVVGGSLWEGKDSRLGKTFWQSTEAMLLTDVSAQGGKFIFKRERPRISNDPNAWFKTSKDASFPSGEVAHISAIVTPFIAEYSKDTPLVWALALLPLYDGVARMKSQAHWQSDVIAGAALGAGLGIYTHTNGDSLLINMLPNGITIGYKTKF